MRKKALNASTGALIIHKDQCFWKPDIRVFVFCLTPEQLKEKDHVESVLTE
jgi:hypothetical protein